MTVARTVSLKGKLPGGLPGGLKSIWNRNSATFEPQNDSQPNNNNNSSNNHSKTHPNKHQSGFLLNRKTPPSPARANARSTITATDPSAGTTKDGAGAASNSHNNNNNNNKKRPRICKVQPTKTGTSKEDTLAYLKREDLQLGPIIGEGGFAQVLGLFACPPQLIEKQKQQQTGPAGGGKENNGNPQVPFSTSSSRYLSSSSAAAASSRSEDSCDTTNLARQGSAKAFPARKTSEELQQQQLYCVKVIRKGLLEKPALFQKAADDLVNEAELLVRMEHTHIIKLRGLSSASRRPLCNEKKYSQFFLLLDQLSETLGDRIELWKHLATIKDHSISDNSTGSSRPPVVPSPDMKRPNLARSQSQAAQLLHTKMSYAYQMADALNYLHEKRILFRDLKPENIGFRKTWKEGDHSLVLFDFGMARDLSSCTPIVAANSSNSNSTMPMSSSSSLPSKTSNHGKPPKPGDAPSLSSNHSVSSSSSGSSVSGGLEGLSQHSAPNNNHNNNHSIGSSSGKVWLSSLREEPPDEFFRMTVCGTQRYMSNEVLLEGRYSLKSDCYSWAMVVWEVFAHAKPFHYMSPSVHKILVARQGDRPPLSCYGLSEDMKQIMTSAWAPRVEDRLSMAGIHARLTTYMQEQGPMCLPNQKTAKALPPKMPTRQHYHHHHCAGLPPQSPTSPRRHPLPQASNRTPPKKGHRKASSMNLPTANSLFDSVSAIPDAMATAVANFPAVMGSNSHRGRSAQPKAMQEPLLMSNSSHRSKQQPKLMRRLIPRSVLRERKETSSPVEESGVGGPPLPPLTAPSTQTARSVPSPELRPRPAVDHQVSDLSKMPPRFCGSLSFDQQSQDSSSHHANGAHSVHTTAHKGLSLPDLQKRKRILKEQLKQYDIRFAQQHGRMPSKDEKEPIRPVYQHYNALKVHIINLERSKRQLKAYDLHFAAQHGRMPQKAEKEAIRHLYEHYKALKVEVQKFVEDFEDLHGSTLAVMVSAPPTPTRNSAPSVPSTPNRRALFAQWAAGSHGFFGGSFDSELTPEGIEVAEL